MRKWQREGGDRGHQEDLGLKLRETEGEKDAVCSTWSPVYFLVKIWLGKSP